MTEKGKRFQTIEQFNGSAAFNNNYKQQRKLLQYFIEMKIKKNFIVNWLLVCHVHFRPN